MLRQSLLCRGAGCYGTHCWDGQGLLCGVHLDALALQQLLSQVLFDALITLDDPAPVPGVEVVWKEKAGRRYMMLLNHRSAKADIPLHGRYTDMLLHRPVQGQLTLKGYDVGILRVEA